MLRIKDNVDFKALEKFGFKHYKNKCYCKKSVGDNIICCDRYETRELDFVDKTDYKIIQDLDTLYDLIIAGYVEKVEE